MKNQSKGINTFQRYLSVWVLLCMAMSMPALLVNDKIVGEITALPCSFDGSVSQ